MTNPLKGGAKITIKGKRRVQGAASNWKKGRLNRKIKTDSPQACAYGAARGKPEKRRPILKWLAKTRGRA